MTNPKRLRGRPRKDPEERKARLLTSAAKLFNSAGYFNVDSNKIAREAGLGPASFYRHFKNKKAAFLEAYALWVEGDWRLIEEAVGGDQTAPNAAELLKRYLERHREWSLFRRSMHALIASDEEARHWHLAIRSKQLDRLKTLLELQGAAQLSPADLLRRFLSFERCANALADGEVAAHGLSEQDFEKLLTEEIEAMLSPDRS